jgi:hypothetical protein
MFRNLPIRSKFITVSSVPLFGLMILAAIGISRSIEVVDRPNETRKVAAFASGADELNEALDWERFVTRMYLLDKRDVPLPHVRSRWAVRDDAVERFRVQGGALAAASSTGMRVAIDEVLADLDQLDDVRQRLLSRSVATSFPEQTRYLKAEGDLGRIKLLAGSATRERLTVLAAQQQGAGLG